MPLAAAIAGRIASRAARSSVARAAPLLRPRDVAPLLPRTLPFSTSSRLLPSLPHVATKHGNVGNDFLNEIKQGFAHQEKISKEHVAEIAAEIRQGFAHQGKNSKELAAEVVEEVVRSVQDVIESRSGRRGPEFFKIILANLVTMAVLLLVGAWVFFEKCKEIDAKELKRYGAIFGKEYEAEKKRQEEEEAQKKERRDDEKKKREKEVQRIVFFVLWTFYAQLQ